MKTYTHPTIIMPCGSVVVKFYDESKSGAETTPDIILRDSGIGDVEDGFDINLGELRVPALDLAMWNKNNYVIGTLLDTRTLRISVQVDGECYFYGIFDPNSFDPDLIEYSPTQVFGKVRLQAVHIFSQLQYVSIATLAADLVAITDPFDPFLYFRQFFRKIAVYCGLTFVAFSDISLVLARNYQYNIGAGYVGCTLEKVMFPRQYLTDAGGNNYYFGRLKNVFELLTELCKEFFLYPTVIYSSGFKLQIIEKDNSRQITPGDAINSHPQIKYSLNSLTTELAGMPDGFDKTGLYFQDTQTYQGLGDAVVNDMHYASFIRGDIEVYATNMIIVVNDASVSGAHPIIRISNKNGYGWDDYISLQEAIHNAYKRIYFDNVKWRQVTFHGLKADCAFDIRMKYMMPASSFYFLTEWHYIHSVRRSIMKNQSVVTCLRLPGAL